MTKKLFWITQQPTFNTELADNIASTAVDLSGNVYVSYISEGGGVISGQTGTGGSYVVVFKIESTTGNCLWTIQKSFGPTGLYAFPTIATGFDGYVYLAFYTGGTSSGQSLTGSSDMVVYKLDPINGNTIWISQQPAFNTSSPNEDHYVKNIAVGPSGNIYVTYFTSGGTASGQTSLGSNDIVVFKLEPINGNCLWVSQKNNFNTPSADNASGICVDGLDNIYVSYQTFSGTVSGQTSAGQSDIVVFKLEPINGDCLWVSQQPIFNTPNPDTFPQIACDTAGNVYIAYGTTGVTSGQTSFGGSSVAVCKLETTMGNVVWITQQPIFNGVNVVIPTTSISVDSLGDIYVAYASSDALSGMTYSSTYEITIFKLISSDGTCKWVVRQNSYGSSGGAGDVYPSIALDSSGNIMVSYMTQGGTASGQTNTGGQDIVVFKLSQEDEQPPCFNHGTKILCSLNNRDEYIPVQEITQGVMVKTYRHGYRRVEMCGSGSFVNDVDKWENSMYIMKKSGPMTDDLIVTGGHSILIDHPPMDKEEIELQRKYCGDVIFSIDNMYMIMASVSKQFTQIKNTNLYTYYHLVLEDDGEDNRHYGIWANGVLTESQSRKGFMNHHYDVIS